jgi:hypothetical protein
MNGLWLENTMELTKYAENLGGDGRVWMPNVRGKRPRKTTEMKA